MKSKRKSTEEISEYISEEISEEILEEVSEGNPSQALPAQLIITFFLKIFWIKINNIKYISLSCHMSYHMKYHITLHFISLLDCMGWQAMSWHMSNCLYENPIYSQFSTLLSMILNPIINIYSTVLVYQFSGYMTQSVGTFNRIGTRDPTSTCLFHLFNHWTYNPTGLVREPVQ